jgi:ribosome biogenesis GTPase
MTGRIIKATGGFYYVDIPRDKGFTRLCCRARGLFRKDKSTPLVGDMAEVEPTVEGEGYITRLLPRKNNLIRPPLANLDRMVLVLSTADPAPNLLVADTCLAILAHREISAIIAVTKTDLADGGYLRDIYEGAGYPVYLIGEKQEDALALQNALCGGVSAFCGNSGAGKSTLLNRMDPRLCLKTGDISHKLGRGRHTTRHVELLTLPGGGLVADTPGFSSLELLKTGIIPQTELSLCFYELEPYTDGCRFPDCSHTVEAGCAVLKALSQGRLAPSRHESYRRLYAEAKKRKPWE